MYVRKTTQVGLLLALVVTSAAACAQTDLAATAGPKYLVDNKNGGQTDFATQAAATTVSAQTLNLLGVSVLTSITGYPQEYNIGSCVRIPDGLTGIPAKSYYWVASMQVVTYPNGPYFPPVTKTGAFLKRFHINTGTNTLVLDQTYDLTAYGYVTKGTPLVDAAGTAYVGLTGGVAKCTIGGTVTGFLRTTIPSSSYGVPPFYGESSVALKVVSINGVNTAVLYAGSNGASGMDTYLVALDASTMGLLWYWRPSEKDYAPNGPSQVASPAIVQESDGAYYIYTAAYFSTATQGATAVSRSSVAKLTTAGSTVWEVCTNSYTMDPYYRVSANAVSIGVPPATGGDGDVYVGRRSNLVAYTSGGAEHWVSSGTGLGTNDYLQTQVVDSQAGSAYYGDVVIGAPSAAVWLDGSTGAAARSVSVPSTTGVISTSLSLDAVGRLYFGTNNNSNKTLNIINPTGANPLTQTTLTFTPAVSLGFSMVTHDISGSKYLLLPTWQGVALLTSTP